MCLVSAVASAPIIRERPILFSAPMIRALLAGTKTQTRRVVTVPWHKSTRALPYSPAWEDEDGELLACDEYGDYHKAVDCMAPYGHPGDRLWVRETWAPQPGREASIDLPEYDGGGNPDAVCYRADECRKGESPEWPEGLTHGVKKWRPSIFMPRWGSRILLEVTNVRIERLRVISEEDAKAEGVDPDFGNAHTYASRDYRRSYEKLWDQINGKRDGCAWADNPWVWRVAFRGLA